MAFLRKALRDIFAKIVTWHFSEKRYLAFLRKALRGIFAKSLTKQKGCLFILLFLQKFGKFIEKCSDLSKNQEYAHMKTLKILGTRFFYKKDFEIGKIIWDLIVDKNIFVTTQKAFFLRIIPQFETSGLYF